MNCEFLKRPNIAISEFTDTLLANTEYLEVLNSSSAQLQE